MKKFNWKDVAFLFVWALVVLAIVAMFTTGCSSPTDPDHHDCTYYVEYDQWIGDDCEQENADLEHRNFWLVLSVLFAFVSLAASAGRKR